MSAQHQRLASFIWQVAELLRGDYKQSEYGKVILPFCRSGQRHRGGSGGSRRALRGRLVPVGHGRRDVASPVRAGCRSSAHNIARMLAEYQRSAVAHSRSYA
ncbi:MAG: type I restriction-modification system subunit M N-terminal domain-containing protein [Pseudonocardiaceae bacterium]